MKAWISGIMTSALLVACRAQPEGEVLRYQGLLGGEVPYTLEIARIELSKPERFCNVGCPEVTSYAEFVLRFDRPVSTNICCENVPWLSVGGAITANPLGENLEALVFRFSRGAKKGAIRFSNSGTDLPVKSASYLLPFEYDPDTAPVIHR